MNNPHPPNAVSFMETALRLACQSRPSPNPRVGAVVVANGGIVGSGFHKSPGMPHAEVMALEDAGPRALGADLYVTLEPCCHYGRTGPCVEAISRHGIARVIVGMIDPDPRVNGQGIMSLKYKGIETVVGVSEKQCQKLLFGYTIHRKTGRPSVELKAAITLDGAMSTLSGDSKWISSETSRHVAHEMRANADAVLVGIETVLKDDPLLTVRHCSGENPIRIVMDSKLRTPLSSKLIASAHEAPILLAHTEAPGESVERFANIQGVETLRCAATKQNRVDPTDLLSKLGQRGIMSLLVEGGSLIHGAFAEQGIADRVALFVAPILLGGGRSWIRFSGTDSLSDALSLTEAEVTPVGRDLLIEARFCLK